MIMIIMITRITNSSELTHCVGSGLQHLCCSVCSMPGIYVLQALEAERASASMAWRWAECQKAAAPRRRNREEMTTELQAVVRPAVQGGASLLSIAVILGFARGLSVQLPFLKEPTLFSQT